MYDLIYTENRKAYEEIKQIIETNYPQVKIEDGSDQIHENRFSIDLEIEIDNWFIFCLNHGFPLCSLNFQLFLRDEPEKIMQLINKSDLIKNVLKLKKSCDNCKYCRIQDFIPYPLCWYYEAIEISRFAWTCPKSNLCEHWELKK